MIHLHNRNEEEIGSPRWGHRSRERSGGTPVRGALKTLSPTRLHHRSNDELRCDDQAKVQLEKLDTQVNTLHSDVSGLTQEVGFKHFPNLKRMKMCGA